MAKHRTKKRSLDKQFKELAREAVIQMFMFHNDAARIIGNVNSTEANTAYMWNKGLYRYGRLEEVNALLVAYERDGGLPFRGTLFPWELSPENLDKVIKGQALPRYGEAEGRPPHGAGLDEIQTWTVQERIGAGFRDLLNNDGGPERLKEAEQAIRYIAEFRFDTTSPVAKRLQEDPVGREITKRVEVLREALVEELTDILPPQPKERGSKPGSSRIDTSKKQELAQKPLTYPVVARMCWCMEKAGKTDHRITDRPSADRLAARYGLSNQRAGEKLKQERDRFDGPDGLTFLKSGRNAHPRYGRRVFDVVKAELLRRAEHEAAVLAEKILSDL